MDHQLTLMYSNDDDGIWLTCSCGWWENLGFSPTPKAVRFAESRHNKATKKASA